MCGFIPMAAPLAIATTSPELFEQLVLTFLVAACARLTLDRTAPPNVLTRPAVLFGALVAISGGLTISLIQQRTYASVRPFFDAFWMQFSAGYYNPTPYGGVLSRVMYWLEALALAVVAERVVRCDTSIRDAAPRLLVVAGAALALFSANRLLEISLAAPAGFAAMIDALTRSRFNPFYRDINAAASVLALFLAPALWLAWRERRVWAALAAAVLTLAMWLAGSRAALGAVVAVLAIAWAVVVRPARRTVIGVGAAVVLVVFVVSATSARNASVSAATTIRLELYRVAVKLTIENPVFGVGLDEFRPRSAPEISPAFRQRYWHFFANGENAHNSFLQILAELGTLGLGAFLWMLAPSAAGLWRTLSRGGTAMPGPALAMGVAAFVLTCLLGHPLLLDDVRWQFFFALGVATPLVTATPAPADRGDRRGRLIFVAGLLFILASAPMRFAAARHTANLAGVIIGTSELAYADDGSPYRLVWTDATWYLDPKARTVALRVRADDVSDEPCGATIVIDGRPADTLSPGRESWTPLAYQLTSTRSGASRRLDVHVTGPQCRVMVSGLQEIR
jgi:hypothetical protein